jgi:hypothetical protein
MKIGVPAVLLVLVVAASAAAPAAPSASDIVVTTVSDATNGNTLSVAALLADPGPDGVSLREAISATNNDPGIYTIRFAPSLVGATIALSSQLPRLLGGGVTVEGDLNGDGKPDVTLSEAAGFSATLGTLGTYCPVSGGCGLSIGSSGNRLHALTLVGFGAGVDIEPWHPGDDAAPMPPTILTLADNVVSDLVMHGIQTFGVLIGSVFNKNCGLYAGYAKPCVTNDITKNTTITGNTIEMANAGDTGIKATLSNAGDRIENITVTDNTIQNATEGIALEVIGNATGAAISGGLVARNSIAGNTGIGIGLVSGGVRAQTNTVENVQVLDNRLNLVSQGASFCCQGIVVEAGGDTNTDLTPIAYPDGNEMQNVLVRGNTISGTLVEGVSVQEGLGGGSNNRVNDIRVEANTITSSTLASGVLIWTVGGGSPVENRDETGNQIARVAVDANRITIGNRQGSQPPGAGGVVILGGLGSNARNASVRDIQIVNDVIGPGHGQILLIGGANGASGDQLDGVRIVNDTVVDQRDPVLQIAANDKGATGNSVSGVTVSNTIFSGSLAGEVVPSMIHSSIVSQASFAGMNGNVLADPRFVDPAHGDFHLQAGSPAIDAGSSSGAPATDFGGRARSDGHVDIGAYEFVGAKRRYTVSISLVGKGRVTSRPAGIACPSRCVGSFPAGTALRLSATQAKRYRFVGWRKRCPGTGPCTFRVKKSQVVSAVFRRR